MLLPSVRKQPPLVHVPQMTALITSNMPFIHLIGRPFKDVIFMARIQQRPPPLCIKTSEPMDVIVFARK